MSAARVLSSLSGAVKKDNVVERSLAIFHDEIPKFDERKETRTDGTTDISDDVNSILDVDSTR